MKYKCGCGRTVRARVPKNGDGSALVPYAHDIIGLPIRCEGSFKTIEWDDLEDKE